MVTLLRCSTFAILAAAVLCAGAAGATEPFKVHVGIRAEFAVAAAGSVWTTNSVERRLVRIDSATNRVSARIKLKGSYPLGITYGAGSIWVANRYSGSVTRVNPKTNKAGQTIRVVFVTRFRAGSILLTVPLDSLVTQMLPAP